ncbi:hypothetical protein E1A91_D09G113200v1 [Gossypium mustelinum]|uniref:Uncharacterized protein n=1 Tax=Gossypium mustelinum TaxID=34275 RepID=A0A5D2TKL5_GOSMU|nr:hypothetical protein E1A91_D09G113200v1 [Gossypium mustelinum]
MAQPPACLHRLYHHRSTPLIPAKQQTTRNNREEHDKQKTNRKRTKIMITNSLSLTIKAKR